MPCPIRCSLFQCRDAIVIVIAIVKTPWIKIMLICVSPPCVRQANNARAMFAKRCSVGNFLQKNRSRSCVALSTNVSSTNRGMPPPLSATNHATTNGDVRKSRVNLSVGASHPTKSIQHCVRSTKTKIQKPYVISSTPKDAP